MFLLPFISIPESYVFYYRRSAYLFDYSYNRTAEGRIKWEEDNRSGLGFESLMSLNFSVDLFATTKDATMATVIFTFGFRFRLTVTANGRFMLISK